MALSAARYYGKFVDSMRNEYSSEIEGEGDGKVGTS